MCNTSDEKDPASVCKQLRQKDAFACSALIMVLQALCAIFMGVVPFTYEHGIDAQAYSFFRDVSIMIFIGFGFLMTFMFRNGNSATGYTLIVSCLVIEMSLCWEYLLHKGADVREQNEENKYPVGIFQLDNALFCSGAAMISYGALLGKVTPFQLMIMAVFETIFFWVNVRLSILELGAHDVGGGMVIHLFGAYFGLAASWWVTKDGAKEHHQEKSVPYLSDIFAMVGTLFLWVLWPSFQSAVASEPQRQFLAICNTFLSLCGSCLAFACVSRLMNPEYKFSLVHMQNATLAGGVMMGVAGDMDMGLHGAMLAGFASGAVSCVGYEKFLPILAKLNIHDVCGVHNLHGIPGFLGSVLGVILAAMYGEDEGKYHTKGFAASHGHGGMSADKQIFATLVSLGLGIAGGLFTGFMMTKVIQPLGLGHIPDEEYFQDKMFFDTEENFHHGIGENAPTEVKTDAKEV